MNRSTSTSPYFYQPAMACPARNLQPTGRAILFAIALLLLAGLGRVALVQAQTGEAIITLDPPSATAGAIVLVNGQGFSPGGQKLTFSWDGKEVATHWMGTGDAFSIPFPVPDDANPGAHWLDVCAGDACARAEQTKKTGRSFQVTGAMPIFSGSVAYIYDTDKEQAAQFASLLQPVGIVLTPIPLADVESTDFGRYRLVIVGSDTGSDQEWGTPSQVEALSKAARIVGIGKGGHALFGRMDLMIGAPNGTQLQAHKIRAGDPQLTSLRVPFDLTALVRNQREMPLFTTDVDTVMVDVPAEITDLLPHALLDGNRIINAGLVVGQGCRTLWGFHAPRSAMTPLGEAFFINLVVFALSNNCDASLTLPCGQLTNQAVIPGFAYIHFDDMKDDAEIGDFYANSYGVRFQKNNTNHAIIYGGHTNDPSQPRSAPNVAANDAITGTSEGVPMPMAFDRDQSYVGMWIGNGEDRNGQPANLTATLTAYDRTGKELCSARLSPVPVSHTAFLGLADAFGRIAYVKLDYGRTANSEALDNLTFGPFFPANNIRVCQQLQTACVPAANAQVSLLRDGSPAGPPLTTDSQGYLVRRQVGIADSLWAFLPISTTSQTVLYQTSGAPRQLQAAEFNRSPTQEMTLSIGPAHPLLLYNLTLSTQWSLLGDTAYQNRLRNHIQQAARYLYDFTDGQVSLGDVQVYQNYDKWDEADVRIYASNNLRPHAEIGGVSASDVTDPLIPTVSYYPGYTFMGRTWNRFNLPGEPDDLGVDISNDWPLALAHELGHYLLYLFDTYLAVTPEGEIVETASCTGSAMGWVYEEANTEFVYDPGHWESACGSTLANHTLKRNEWDTIRLWYSSLSSPTAVNPGPHTLPAAFTQVTIHPPANPVVVLPNQTFTLNYQAGESASGEARAFLLRGNRVIDQGKPAGGTTEITLVGSQTDDRFCVFDVNDFTEDASEPRHQYGCEVLALGDNSLQMEKDDGWAPIIEISHATSRTIGISVTQEISAGLSLRAVLYPEDTDTPTEIVLAGSDGFYTGTFHSPVDATSAYVQIFVSESARASASRRETLVDYGVGGHGAEGPAHLYGGAPVISSDGQAEFARTTDIYLEKGEFIALQSMVGIPRPPVGREIVGQAYRLVALPRALVEEGNVTLRTRPFFGNARRAQVFLKVVVAFWDGSVWTPIQSINLDDLVDARVAIAPSRGVGVYALFLEEETPSTNPLYLPQIER
ncbi:MAG: hypothetical protein DWI57_01330 [Chloroflexi bacterium]|nr:MAG: hypothetical protein DWI57_01330 [Chloroflexota bacterium]